MPSYRYNADSALTTYQPDLDAWVALYNDPIYRTSFESIFNARTLPEMDNSNSWMQALPNQLLSTRDRRAMRNLYESLKSDAEDNGAVDLSDLGLPGERPREDLFGNPQATGNGDLLGEIRRNADSLLATAAKSSVDDLFGRTEILDPEGAAEDGTSNVLGTSDKIVSARGRATGPSLANTPLGALGIEALKPILQSNNVVIDSLRELRHYVLLEQPKTSTLMMLDGGSGQALIMQTSNDPNLAERGNMQQNSDIARPEVSVQPRMISEDHLNFLNRPFRSLLWDIFSSTAAVVIYFLLFVAWLAWRKVISHHV